MNKFSNFFFHISGSAGKKATKENIELAHSFIKSLVLKILKENGNLVITFGDESTKDGLPLSFDFSILEVIEEFLNLEHEGDLPIIKSILYESYERKMPLYRKDLVSRLKKYSNFHIKILPDLDSYGGNLRNEICKNTDLLFILGGSKGVYDLIKKFTQKRKIVYPLNINLENPSTQKFIEMINDGMLEVYPETISSTLISQVNKFSLTSDLDITIEINKIMGLILRFIEDKEELILDLLLNAIITLQECNRAIKPSEDKYTIILVQFLRGFLKPYGYYAHSQELAGRTPLGYDDTVIHGGMGELDIRIVDDDDVPKHICEAFMLSKLDSTKISNHLNKIFDYDLNGLPINFIIIYSKAEEFSTLWTDYLEFLNKMDWKYELKDGFVKDISSSKSWSAEIKIGLTKHIREQKVCKIYHININLT